MLFLCYHRCCALWLRKLLSLFLKSIYIVLDIICPTMNNHQICFYLGQLVGHNQWSHQMTSQFSWIITRNFSPIYMYDHRIAYNKNFFLYWRAVCVCVYTLPPVVFFRLHDVCDDIVRSLDQRSFVVSISRGFCQVPSSLFLNLSYFTSKDENSSW